ncbi:MAG: hypothetical protein IKL48_01320 [Elusimicrobiaceae bacterium]|nr:hypothetical protein [Elusimicrobiaceae bacterium]
MEWIQNNAKDLLAILGVVVTLSTMIVKLTPTSKDDRVLQKVIKVLSALSLCNPDGSFSK